LSQRTKQNETGRRFCFAPTAIATASPLPEDIRAHALVVPMSPPPPGDRRMRIELSDPPEEVLALRAHMQAAIAAAPGRIAPEATVRHKLGPRAAENWHPLLALAACIGADVAARIAEAAAAFAAAEPPPASNLALLRDIRDLCPVDEGGRITSQDMVEKLVADEDRPWTTAHRGGPLTKRTLAERLARFGLRPRVLRKTDGTFARGYQGEHLVDAFALSERHRPQ
jgi:putative DNA primase/helicase